MKKTLSLDEQNQALQAQNAQLQRLLEQAPGCPLNSSIKERLTPSFDLTDAVKEQVELQALLSFDLPIKPLARFEGSVANEERLGILFSLEDYLELIDHTGRCIRRDKRGAIPNHLPAILHRLSIDHDIWLANATQFEKDYNAKFSRRCRRRCKSA